MPVECLRCGCVRRLSESEECPRCLYVGWAPCAALSEAERRRLRDRPPELRRLRPAS